MIRKGLATMGACLILTSAAAGAAEGDAGTSRSSSWVSVAGLLATRYEAAWNVHPAINGPDDDNESKPLAFLIATLSVRPVTSIEGVLTLASREISPDTIDDGSFEERWSNTRFIDEAWIKASHGSAWLKAGKQRLIIGRGLVLDSYQPAVAGSVTVAHDAPGVSLKAFGASLDEDGVLREDLNPYAGGRVDIAFPTAGRLSLSVSRLWDRNALIPTLLPINIQLALNDELFRADDGVLTYWVIDGATEGGRWSVGGLFVLQTGTLTGVLAPSAPLPARDESITLSGKATQLVATYDVTDEFTLRAMGLYTSGDGRGPVDVVLDQRYEAFVGLFPFIDATNLFFNGGIDAAFASGTPTASGVLGRGVLAGVLTGVATFDRTTLRVAAADLWSEFSATADSGRHYGVEFDTEWAYRITDAFTARLEGDVLFPGSFYHDADPDPEPVYKLAVGLDVAW
ncbi:MAG: hypothetical protein ACOYXU_09085 [Nitrospirota bacterium]